MDLPPPRAAVPYTSIHSSVAILEKKLFPHAKLSRCFVHPLRKITCGTNQMSLSQTLQSQRVAVTLHDNRDTGSESSLVPALFPRSMHNRDLWPLINLLFSPKCQTFRRRGMVRSVLLVLFPPGSLYLPGDPLKTIREIARSPNLKMELFVRTYRRTIHVCEILQLCA